MEYTFFETDDGQLVSFSDVEEFFEDGSIWGTRKSDKAHLKGVGVDAVLVEKKGDAYFLKANPSIRVDARSFKMSKSRGNVVNPDKIVADYGADAFRLYEMYMGPLEAQKPWSTRDIVGMSRFLNAVWRNLVGEDKDGESPATGSTRVGDVEIPDALERQLHRMVKKVAEDIEGLRFNTAIAELIKVNNELTKLPAVPEWFSERFVLALAPFAPHIAEEIWHRLGHEQSLARHQWPAYDPAKLVESNIELPVQVNGKLRGKITVPADADQGQILAAAKADAGVKPWVEGKAVVKELYVPKKLVNFVVK
jgi:leucyl-tRNA synthetase